MRLSYQPAKLTWPANERTWHNWLALSNATSWMGIVVAQTSKISYTLGPHQQNILIKKACICQILSIIIILIGTHRFFCEQRAINGTGKRASQWTLLATGVLIFLVSQAVSQRKVADSDKLAFSFFIMLLIADATIFGIY